MRVNHLTTLLLPLLATTAVGCRETCSDDELRYGDRCVLRPDASTFGDEDASAIEEDGGESVDELDAVVVAPEEDASVPALDNPSDADADADAGVEGSGTETSLCPNARNCHREVVQFTYGAPGCAILDDGTLWCWGGVDGPRVPQQVGTASTWQVVSSSDNFNPEAGAFARPGNHTCGISAGAMYCWGENYAGQLGVGASDINAVPTPQRVGDATDWTAVATAAMPIAGAISCGVRAGALYCWGGSSRLEPTRVGSRDDWVSVSANVLLTCGIAGGMARCWESGSDANDEPVASWTDWQTVSSGATHACGIRGGKAYCWGQNAYGQLGVGTLAATVGSPVQVGTAEDWTFIDTSFTQTCGIRAGELYCWGALALRNVSELPPRERLTLSPLRIGTDSDWATVDVGMRGGCARRRNGQLGCWGINVHGQLGTERIPTARIAEPTQVGEGDNWVQVATGSTSTCGLRGGEIYCWGTMYERPTFAAHIRRSFAPTRVGSGTDWTRVAMHFNADHACGLSNDGLSPTWLWCWGDASSGQLGSAFAGSSSSEPVQVTSASEWLDVAVGPDTACGRTNNGIECWGVSWSGVASAIKDGPLRGGGWTAFGTTMGIYDGRLAEWTSASAAAYSAVSSDTGWTAIARGENHACGIREGQLYCWGDNSRGQLGIGAEAVNLVFASPVLIRSPSSWIAVAAGDGASCGVRADKSLWCWGAHALGVSALDAPIATEPRAIAGEWETVAMGGEHSCAISSRGTLSCWGRHWDGQLGLGEMWSDPMQTVAFPE